MGLKVNLFGALAASAALVIAPALVAQAATVSVSNNFNTGDQVAESYTVYTPTGAVSQVAGDGISGSGSLFADPAGTDTILVTKQAFDISGVGQSVVLSAFVHNTTDSGYFTMGVTSYEDVSTHTTYNSALRPDDAAGFAVHGGGFLSLAEDEETDGNWDSDDDTYFDVVHVAPVGDTIGATSDDQWYKIVVKVTRVSDTAFDLGVELWPANADGSIVDGATEPIAEYHRSPDAPTVAAASQVYGYIGFSWSRFDHADNVVITGDAVGAIADGEGQPTLPDTGSNTLVPGSLAIASLLAGAVVLVAVQRYRSR